MVVAAIATDGSVAHMEFFVHAETLHTHPQGDWPGDSWLDQGLWGLLRGHHLRRSSGATGRQAFGG